MSTFATAGLCDTCTRTSADAVRIRLGPEIRPERMKHYLLRIARELNVPVTVRKVAGGVIFWRSSDVDVHQP